MKRITLLLAAVCAAPLAYADFAIPGFELIQTAPLETTLVNRDLRDPTTVWIQLFDGATREIVIGQFYAVSKAGTPFDRVVDRLAAAGRRGVKIRFLLDRKGIGMSDPATVERLRAVPNLELRILDYGKLTGTGINHAKYLAVDGKAAYIGSQNFDWRSFMHIHETGLLVTDPTVVGQVLAVFEQDWRAHQQLSAGDPVPRYSVVPLIRANGPVQLLSSPAAYNPAGVADSEAVLPTLLADAKNEIRIQLLDYAPLGYGPDNTRPYYGVIDNALRTAATRGVTVKLLVSNWNLEQPALAYLKSLALVPHVQVKIATLPPASGGPIPYARVIHSKIMSIDGKLAWVGTSNWAGGYFDKSRNLEVVLRNEKMAQRLSALHEQTWSSPYAQPLDIARDYPKPNKAAQ